MLIPIHSGDRLEYSKYQKLHQERKNDRKKTTTIVRWKETGVKHLVRLYKTTGFRHNSAIFHRFFPNIILTKLCIYFQKITSNITFIIFFIDNDCKSSSSEPNRHRFKVQTGDVPEHNSVISENSFFAEFSTEYDLFLLES